MTSRPISESPPLRFSTRRQTASSCWPKRMTERARNSRTGTCTPSIRRPERREPGSPSSSSGAPTNDPTRPFNAMTAMQRPGLLLMNGVVYAGFASHCDYTPFVGYVVGVSTSGTADDDVGDRVRQRQRGGRNLAVRRRTGIRRPRPNPARHRERHFPEGRPGQ